MDSIVSKITGRTLVAYASLLIGFLFLTIPYGIVSADTFYETKSDGSGLVSPGISALDTSACFSAGNPSGKCNVYTVYGVSTQNDVIATSTGVFTPNMNAFYPFSGSGAPNSICRYISSGSGYTGTLYGYTCGTFSGGVFVPTLATSTPTTTPSFGYNSAQQTRFLDVEVSDGTGTSSVQIDVVYFLEESEINTTISAFNPTLVKFSLSLRPSASTFAQSETISATTYGTSTVDTLFSSGIVDGVYDLLVSFSNPGVLFGSAIPFEKSYVYTSFVVSGGAVTATTTNEYYNNLDPQNPLTPQPCGLTDLSGCLINGLAYTFYPSETAITAFGDIYETLSGKFPFAYLTDFRDSITEMYDGSTVSSLTITVPFGTFGDITLLSADLIEAVPFSDTIRTILGALIWIMFAVQMWNRTRSIFNVNPV